MTHATPMHRTLRYSDRLALVTGGGSGIGAATVRLLAAEGAEVWCCERDLLAAERLARELAAEGCRVEPIALDVCREAEWQRLFDELARREQAPDLLVNCAGIAAAQPLLETTLEEWRRVLAINLDGVFLGTRFALAAMRERGGAIVNVGSASGIRAVAGAAAYCTSKAALTMFTRAAAKECHQLGIRVRVNSVCPAGVKTPMWTTMPFFQELVAKLGSADAAYAELAGTAPNARFAEPAEIAAAIAWLGSNEATHVTGTELVVDGGWLL